MSNLQHTEPVARTEALAPAMSIYDLEQLKQMGVDLSHVPLNNPPSGLQSNFVNPRNEKGSAIGVMSVFMTIMVVFVIMRMYTKLRISRCPGWDDCMSRQECFRTMSLTKHEHRDLRYGCSVCRN